MSEITEDDDQAAISARSERLREALAKAGGAAAVAKRIGMPPTTISNYVAGRDMKCSALVALADACNVSIEWLAAGRGSPYPDASAQLPQALQDFEALLPLPANFWALITILRSCQEWFEGAGITPTLAHVFRWLCPIYETAHSLPDQKLIIQPAKDYL